MKLLEKLKISPKLEKEKLPSTQTSVKFLLILGNCFALLPVKGTTSPRVTDLQFKWKSWKIVYAALSLLATIFIVLMGFLNLFKNGIKFEQLVEHIFYVSAIVTTVLFLHLAYNWSNLMTEWYKVDIAMEKNYGYPKKLNIKLKITTLTVMILAIVEYQLSLATHYFASLKYSDGKFNFSVYYSVTFPQVFSHLPYSPPIAILLQCVSLLSTFTWTYGDLFVMLMSTVLAVRFKQVTERLRAQERMPNSNVFWIEIREDYDRLCNLCKCLDDSLSYLVLTSFATNLVFILVQLFNSLRIRDEVVEKVYFFYSFGFLIFRTIAVSLYAAAINDESREPSIILNSVPSATYNNEIRRFLLQISFDNVALTGCKMFKVTRGLILNVAGAIVTYELVLIQFNGSTLQTMT